MRCCSFVYKHIHCEEWMSSELRKQRPSSLPEHWLVLLALKAPISSILVPHEKQSLVES